MSKRSYIINGTQLNELSIRWRTIYEATDHCADTDCLLCRFGVLTRGALHAQFTFTNGLYGRKTFMPPPSSFTAGILLFSERSNGDVINLRSCMNFRLLSRLRNCRTFCLSLDKVFGFLTSRVNVNSIQIGGFLVALKLIELKHLNILYLNAKQKKENKLCVFDIDKQ